MRQRPALHGRRVRVRCDVVLGMLQRQRVRARQHDDGLRQRRCCLRELSGAVRVGRVRDVHVDQLREWLLHGHDVSDGIGVHVRNAGLGMSRVRLAIGSLHRWRLRVRRERPVRVGSALHLGRMRVRRDVVWGRLLRGRELLAALGHVVRNGRYVLRRLHDERRE
jgi:hypothetical protein